jgi:hypothetical protein
VKVNVAVTPCLFIWQQTVERHCRGAIDDGGAAESTLMITLFVCQQVPLSRLASHNLSRSRLGKALAGAFVRFHLHDSSFR